MHSVYVGSDETGNYREHAVYESNMMRGITGIIESHCL